MKHLWTGLLLLTGVFLVSNVGAAEKSWTDEAELSFVSTNGNSKVTTLSAKNLLKVPFSESFSGSWKLQGLYGKNDGVKNAEAYMTEFRGDYAQSNRLYYFASAGWFQNKFSGIDNRYVYGLGSGYKVLDGPKNFLLGEARKRTPLVMTMNIPADVYLPSTPTCSTTPTNSPRVSSIYQTLTNPITGC